MTTRRNRKSSPRFNINHNSDNKVPELIYLIYRYKKDDKGNNVILKYSTGMKVPGRQWNNKLQQVKNGVLMLNKEVEAINVNLYEVKQKCLKIVTDNPDISVDDFKNQLDYFTNRKKKPKEKADFSVIDYVRLFIKKSKNQDRTIAKYNGVLNHLVTYQNHLGYVITFDQMNAEFSENFVNWMYRKYEFSQNNVSKIIQTLKQFIRDAHQNGYHNNILYQNRKFGVGRVTTTKHFLELTELEKLAKHDFSNKPNYEKTRDLWLVAAYTGLRYSDFSKLKAQKIIKVKGREMIKLSTYKGRTTKSDTEVVIPVITELRDILTKYKYKLPSPFSNQKMNKYIKELCREAELNRLVDSKQSKGGKIKIEQVQLCDKITVHSARFTFINIMLNDFVIAPFQLQKITGQSLKVLMGYERRSKEINALDVFRKIQKVRKKKQLRVI